MSDSRHKILDVVLLPEQTLQLEWSDSGRRPGKSTALLQERIFSLFENEPENWLLYLGFADRDVSLAPSLKFWRDFANLFVRCLHSSRGQSRSLSHLHYYQPLRRISNFLH